MRFYIHTEIRYRLFSLKACCNRHWLHSENDISGHTLLELVVVVACIAMLVGLLAEGVFSARSAMRRFQCTSQLAEQIRGAIMYESLQKHLPSNGWGSNWMPIRERGIGIRQPGGWIYNILPFVEEQTLHQMAPTARSGTSLPYADDFVSTEIPILLCPARTVSRVVDISTRFTPPHTSVGKNAARGDYAANGGWNNEECGFSNGPRSLSEGDSRNYPWMPTRSCNGISFRRSEVRVAHIKDGTSNVIFSGEKRYNGIGDQGMNQPIFSGDCWDTRRTTEGHMLLDATDTAESVSTLLFGSAHLDGVGFSFCDGSVRVLDYDMDAFLFRSLGSRNDGN
jgi:Protein of unknown function (DUF1559)